jgi:hypothetical protein
MVLFQPSVMAPYIKAVIEQKAFKSSILPNRKISLCVFSLYAK